VKKTTILGAGISGLSISYHLGHDGCIIYEASDYYGGHTNSELRDGFTWDEGPHVNYGKNEYVSRLFAESVDQEVLEFCPVIRNYFRGHFIDHPAQSNLYQIPEPLRTQCRDSFVAARSNGHASIPPRNYQEWIDTAFGPVFAETFPAAYTRKYWTTEPRNLGTDWLEFVAAELPRRSRHETRIYYPTVEDVKAGYYGPLQHNTHYATTFRYPARGGFVAFLRKLAEKANVQYRKRLTRINFKRKELEFSDGFRTEYDGLVSTIPLPVLIGCSQDAPDDIKEAAGQLRCTSILLIEVTANHPTKRDDQFLYVYDEDKLSTRISITERFSPNNAPPHMTGISAEVYGSPYRPLPNDREEVARRVQAELVEIGLIESLESVASVRVRQVPYAQVIFDHNRRPALDKINSFLDEAGVWRLGRYAEWEYLMTHDCVMASRQIAENIICDSGSRISATGGAATLREQIKCECS
jgi:protoporphyrinogen oxidase